MKMNVTIKVLFLFAFTLVSLQAQLSQEKSGFSLFKKRLLNYLSDIFTPGQSERPMTTYPYRRRCIWKICSHPIRKNQRTYQEPVIRPVSKIITVRFQMV